MARDEGETVEFEAIGAEPRFYGRPVHVALLVLAAAAVGAAAGLLVRGESLIGVLLLLAEERLAVRRTQIRRAAR
jgi:hypothetical protein